MLKSSMDFFDVVFPLNLGALTYSAPPEISSIIRPGMAVKAELKRKEATGIVIRKAPQPAVKKIKAITAIASDYQVFSEHMLSLLKWVSGYYIVSDGLALKSMLPKEVLIKKTANALSKPDKAIMMTNKTHTHHDELALSPADKEAIAAVRESADKKEYRSYLFHAETAGNEISVLLRSLNGISNAIVLVPETSMLESLAGPLTEIYGERLSVLHGKLASGRRRSLFERILSGSSDIVLGTRPAVFAPLRKVSFIAVLHEHSRSYKNLEGLRYSARDVAVMRGYLEKAVVLLSSPAPSIESFHNTSKGKYTLLRHEMTACRPRVEIVKMQTARKTTPYLSKRVTDAAKTCANRGGTSLFLINRKGYSVLQCRECSHIEACPDCSIPLVYYKNEKTLKCHYCGHVSAPYNTCRKCRGTRFDMVGAGTERIASDIKNHLSIEPLKIDKEIIRKNPLLRDISGIVSNEEIIVGTKIVTKRLVHSGTFCACAFLNPDAGLHIPDFRSSELLFQELAGISEHVMANGILIIQTRMPDNHVYKCIRKFDYPAFFKEELLRRKSLLYPPFSRLIMINITSKLNIDKDITAAMKETAATAGEAVEVMGPLGVRVRNNITWKILLKSGTKVSLHLYVHNFIRNFGCRANFRITVDVDPVYI